MWKDEIDLVIKIFSKHHIHVEATFGTNGRWRLTGVYGHPDVSQREHIWNLLKSLKRDFNEDLPWLMFGDFNKILFTPEKLRRKWCPENKMW